jgi:hypothetical protein
MLTKRKFPDVKQAIDDLREGSESNILFDNGMLCAGEIVRRHASRLERWVIFNKGIGQCMIILASGRMLIRLSMEEVTAVCIPVGRAYTLFPEASISYKVLEVEK